MQQENNKALVKSIRRRGRPEREAQPIVNAAITIFARDGYSAAKIDNIAAEASVSTATLYKKFENKQNLFVAVLAQVTQTYWEDQDKEASQQPHPFQRLFNSLQTHANIGSDPKVRGIMRAWLGEVRQDSEIAELFARNSGVKLIDELRERLTALYEEGYIAWDSDEPDGATIAAQMMLGIVERFTLMRGLVWGDHSEPMLKPDQLANKAIQALIAIYGTTSGNALLNSFRASRSDQ